MPKTEIKKIESEDVKELADEALDRAGNETVCVGSTICAYSSSSSPR